MSQPAALLIAAGFFSRFPAPPVTDVTADVARRAVRWLPTLGLLLGLPAALAAAAGALLSGSHLLGAVLAVCVLQLLVGAMHLDGLADSCDGLAALGSRKDGRDRAMALEVMRRPDVGAMGVTAIALGLGVQVAALAALPDWRTLAAACLLGPVAGRLAVLAATRPGVPAARPGGFGALMSGATPVGQLVAQLAAWLVVAAALGWLAAGLVGLIGWPVALTAALLVSIIWSRHLVGRLGGLTGDCFGALVEVTTTACWIGLAIAS